MSDIRMKIGVSNARLFREIEIKFGTQTNFANHIGVSAQTLNGLVAMRSKPVYKNGEWTDLAMKVCAGLNASPDEFWPEHMRDIQVKRSITRDVSLDEIRRIADTNKNWEQKSLINDLSEDLNERELIAVEMRSRGMTYEELAQEFNVCKERARQIEQRALGKMRRAAAHKFDIKSGKDFL